MSPTPTSLSIHATIESEAEYPAGEVYILAYVALVADSLPEDRCLDVEVAVGGESAVLVEDEDCDGIVSWGVSAEACEGRLPGRCTLSEDLVMVYSEEIVVQWEFGARVRGNIEGCRGEAPPTTVIVSFPD